MESSNDEKKEQEKELIKLESKNSVDQMNNEDVRHFL